MNERDLEAERQACIDAIREAYRAYQAEVDTLLARLGEILDAMAVIA